MPRNRPDTIPDPDPRSPPKLTAARPVWMHSPTAFESYVSNVFHPIADSIAFEALGYSGISQLHTKMAQNREARGYMMIAAMMGALAFSKDPGAAHSSGASRSLRFRVSTMVSRMQWVRCPLCDGVQPRLPGGKVRTGRWIV